MECPVVRETFQVFCIRITPFLFEKSSLKYGDLESLLRVETEFNQNVI